MEKPRFIHDCDACVFLGAHGKYDCYWCANCDGGSMIWRHGDNGPQYGSIPVGVFASVAGEPAFASETHIFATLARAIRLGLYSREQFCRKLHARRHKLSFDNLPCWYSEMKSPKDKFKVNLTIV